MVKVGDIVRLVHNFNLRSHVSTQRWEECSVRRTYPDECEDFNAFYHKLLKVDFVVIYTSSIRTYNITVVPVGEPKVKHYYAGGEPNYEFRLAVSLEEVRLQQEAADDFGLAVARL